jgi:hypothetical protein
MRWLRNLFQSKKASSFSVPTQPAPLLRGVTITRGGKEVTADEVFAATNSQDLPRMIAATRFRTNPVDRHFLLQNIVGLTYTQRKQVSARQLCIEYARIHMAEFPSIKPHLIKDMDGQLPRASTFQKLATVYAEDSRFAEAISVCEQAINLGLEDGTQSGFEGRIKRIRKKQAGEAGSSNGG